MRAQKPQEVLNAIPCSDMLKNRILLAMSWKDLLTPEERQELLEIEAEKAKVVRAYQATWRKLKARCDARKRRASRRKNDDDDADSSSRSP